MGYATFIKVIDQNRIPTYADILIEYANEMPEELEELDDRQMFISGVQDVLENIKQAEFSLNFECGDCYATGVSAAMGSLRKSGAIKIISDDEIYTETKVIVGFRTTNNKEN